MPSHVSLTYLIKLYLVLAWMCGIISFSKPNLHFVARNILTVVLSGQGWLHGQDIRQTSGKNGRRALRSSSLPSPARVLPNLPRELLCWRNAGSVWALAGPYISDARQDEWQMRKSYKFFVSPLRLALTEKLTFHPLMALLIWIVAHCYRSHWESDRCSANTELRFGLNS